MRSIVSVFVVITVQIITTDNNHRVEQDISQK